MAFRWTSIFTAVVALGTVGITTLPASAQYGRAINVNGQWLNPQQIFEADQIAGFQLPNGYYWWSPTACVWGVVNNPSPIGRAPCGGNGIGPGNGIRQPGPSVILPGPCEGGNCVNLPRDYK
jgi:hypothetical protein